MLYVYSSIRLDSNSPCEFFLSARWLRSRSYLFSTGIFNHLIDTFVQTNNFDIRLLSKTAEMAKLLYFLTMGLALDMAANAAGSKAPKYKDSSASVEERVSDLLSRMTIEEKTAQLIQGMVMSLTFFSMKKTEED